MNTMHNMNDPKSLGWIRWKGWHSRLSASLLCLFACAVPCCSQGIRDVVQSVQPKLVKIHGAGGLRGLEAYQSGFLISSNGLILTAWSYVLDADPVSVTLHDGKRLDGHFVAADPRLEIALLKVDIPYTEYFDLDDAIELTRGNRVLAWSNLYGVAAGNEPLSVQHGIVTAVTSLDARRGTYASPYRGRVYVLDAMCNNAGAAGGALTDWKGQIAGVLGKELRNNLSGIWLNYAIPIAELRASVQAMQSGRILPAGNIDGADLPEHPWTVGMLGLQLVPNVLTTTPPYIESVQAEGPAAKAALQVDDLITFVQGQMVRSQREFLQALRRIQDHETLSLSVLRDDQLISVSISPP